MKMIFRKASAWIAVLLFLIPFTSGSCAPKEVEEFAIYLTREDIPPAKMATLSQTDLADVPLISIKDIIYYNSQTYELKLTSEAFQRICNLKVPVQGKSFIVSVDKKPVYWGAFWTPISSISFNGITIWQPIKTAKPEVITFETGYPSSSFYGGNDPRNSPEILNSLEKAGKLISKLTIKDIDKLPLMMKGYELYSWQESGQWNFTLIYGTNRNKNIDEIISKDDLISEKGLIRIHVTDIEALKTVLSKMPEGEFVTWSAGFRGETGPTDIKFELPPDELIKPIKEFTDQHGIKLQIP
jgi:hypothetical protein